MKPRIEKKLRKKQQAAEAQAREVEATKARARVKRLEATGAIEWVDQEGWVAECIVCKEITPIWCDPEEFDPDYHYCGGSPRCCP